MTIKEDGMITEWNSKDIDHDNNGIESKIVLSVLTISCVIFNILSEWLNYCWHFNQDRRSYLPTPPLGQDMTQGQIFKRSLTGLNSEFSFS